MPGCLVPRPFTGIAHRSYQTIRDVTQCHSWAVTPLPVPATRSLRGHVLAKASGSIVEGHLTTSPSTSSPGTAQRPSSGTEAPFVEGQPATPVVTPAPAEALESLDDMAAFVERTRVEEENIRRKREEVELQLLRMRQQEAVRRQQAIRLRLATERANAAIVRDQAGSNAAGSTATAGGTAGPGAASPPGVGASAGAAGAGAPAPAGPPAPPRKKVVLKKSKRLQAVAAAAGLHRVTSPHSSAAQSPSPSSPSAPGASPSSASSPLVDRGAIIDRMSRDGGAMGAAAGGTSDSECDLDEVVVPKPIFILSDCTGESAARTVRAALNQFEARCRTQAPAQIMIFRFVESEQKVMDILREATKEDALVVYTLVDPKIVKKVQAVCSVQGLRYVDLWSTLLDSMEVHLNAVRSGIPASLAEARKPKASLTDEYFKMIEAVEFTRKLDDGAHPGEWAQADLVILGVSRCGKTPLSIYLGQRGYKVANLPLIPGCPVPRELFEIDQTRIVGLIIDPAVLSSIRRNRVSMMGVARAQAIDYAEVQKINSELDWARALYNAHPEWPVLDVTLRGIEETAARILKLLNDRRGDSSPMWVEAAHSRQGQGGLAGQPGQVRPLAAASGPLGQRDSDAVPSYTNIPELIYGANESSFLLQGLY